jgi:hypothetical protein
MCESSHRDIWKRNGRSTCEGGNTELLCNIQKNAIKNKTREECISKWQRQLEETTKGAITKDFFPSVERRLAVNLHLNLKVTTIMKGHGNIRSYLHRLNIIG